MWYLPFYLHYVEAVNTSSNPGSLLLFRACASSFLCFHWLVLIRRNVI